MRKSNGQKLRQVSALAVAIHLGFSASAWSATALPQGASVVNGQVLITKPSDNSLQINATAGAIINWQQFSIGSNGQVRFTLPNAGSSVLNRVVGADSSQLMGSLQSNGRVFLINPNGIVVGAGARIDTNSFIASTLDTSDSDFLAGKLRFLATAGAGSIRNDGVISAGPGGRIALIAPDIQNTGIIQAPNGQILLAAGRKLEISSLDFEGVSFEIQAPTDSVLNLGQLLAENGAVSAFAGTLRHSGEIRASSLVLDSEGSIRLSGSNEVSISTGSVTVADGVSHGGTITIQSSNGTTHVAGNLSAIASAGQGGTIEILGNRVALDAGARVDASGTGGGGQILVGGDFQGKNAAIQNASRVYVDTDASLKADALQNGDGGKVVVWADENTRYLGSLSARGGVDAGNGGNAEVSGKQNLLFAGSADMGAAHGQSGSLLLDPLDILVSTGGGILPTVVDQFADFSANVVTISPTAMNNVKGTVTLQAQRDIYFNSAVTLGTAGAGLTATAGGSTFDAAGGGQIYLNQNISTNAGAVTLRAVGVSGSGTITSNGGAVDIKTSGSESFSSTISSGGGAVRLESGTGSVYGANVNAGSGAVNLTTTTGSISSSTLTGGTVTLAATGGSVSSVNVNAATQVNASSSNSYIYILNSGGQPLRVGTVTSPSTVQLRSDSGFEQAAGGMLTAASVYLYNDSSTAAAGTVAAPLQIASPQLYVSGYSTTMATPAHINFSGSPTLSALNLNGDLAALASTTITGAANLSTLTLTNASGALSVTADSGTTSGFGSGFQISVSDAAITAPSLNLLGGNITLNSSLGLTIGSLNAASLYATAKGAVSLGTVSTTGSGGIYVSTNSCTAYYVGCSASSPITATALTAGAGAQVYLQTRDNGDINISGSLSAGSASLYAGNSYYTTSSYPYYSMRTGNNITVASATTSTGFAAYNYGVGNVTFGSLAATGNVSLNAGGSYLVSDPSYYYGRTVYTTNNIALTVAEPTTPTGSFQVSNSGVGNVSITGAINRPSGSISLSAANGNVTAVSDLSAYSSIYASAGSGALSLANVSSSNGAVSLGAGTTLSVGNISANASVSATSGTTLTSGDITSTTSSVSASAGTSLTVGQVLAGSSTSTSNYSTSLSAGGDLSFLSINSSALAYYAQNYGYGSVSLTSTSGSIKTRQDNAAADVSSSANVTLSANGSTSGVIGDASFAHPMDIISGTLASNSVTLSAGMGIGALGKAVNVDTSGVLSVSSAADKFFVAAQSMNGLTQRSLSGIRLSASAAGLGNGGTSALSSLDLSVNASSDGNLITIGDIVRSTGALNEFRFTTTNGGLNFGNINLGTTGYNQLLLTSAGAMAQTSPVSTNNISAGYINLNSGSNAMVVGNVTSSTAGANSVGNVVGMSGGDITAGNLSGLGINVSGANLNLGTVTSSGTNRGYYSYYLYVPHLGSYQYVTDELHLSASAALNTTGNISSQTSAYVSGVGVTVAGGTGTISGGHTDTYYYADRISVQSGAGNLAAGAINGYDVSLTGANIVTGNVSANRTLGVGDSNTATLTVGNLIASGPIIAYGSPSISLSAAAISTGNVSTSNSLSVTTSGSYVPGAIGIAAGSTNVIATNDIDLTAATLSSPTINLNSAAGNITAPVTGTNVTLVTGAGNINATLSGTSNLTLRTGGQFTVTSSAALSTLDVSADGVAAGAGTGSTVTDVANQVMKVVDAAGALTLTFKPSSAAIHDYYRESNALVTDIALSTNGTLASGSSVYLSAPAALVSTPSVTMANGTLQIATGGDINLASVDTGGGWVSASSSAGAVTLGSVTTSGGWIDAYAGSGAMTLTTVNTGGGSVSAHTSGATSDVNVVSVNSGGGSVTLTSDNGSIVASGTGPQIDSRNASGAPAGTTILSAANGSVGSSGAQLQASGALSLVLNARDAINVDVANTTLTNLGVTTQASGSGAIAISDTNFSGLSITRVGGTDLNLSALQPGASAAFSLTARDGNIKVLGDISNVSNLTLDAGYGLSSGNLIIQAPSGVARALTASGDLTLKAGNDVRIAAGAALTDTVQVQSANNMSVLAGHDILITADGGSALLKQTSANYYYYTQTVQAGNDIRILGGSPSGLAGASASIVGQGYYQSVTAGHDLTVLAGSGTGAASGAFASLQSSGSQNIAVTHDLLIQGGAASGAYASVLDSGSQTVSANNLSVLGAGAGAYAALTGGSQNAATLHGNVLVMGGAGAGAYAEVVASSSSQTLGYQVASDNNFTKSLTIQGGDGVGAYASVRAAAGQEIHSIGAITVQAGSQANTRAEIVSASGNQNIGGTASYVVCYYYYCTYASPTDSVLVKASAADIAKISAVGTESILAGVGGIAVRAGSVAGMTASIETTAGSQTIGSSSTSSNVPTSGIEVTAGAGGAAWIRASGSQSLMTGGDISVTGGSGTNATASIESTGGTQSIGNNYSYFNDPSNNITVQGGSGTGAAAWIRAAGSQTLMAGGDISVLGGAGVNSSASIESTAGSQTIGGSYNYYYDPTNSIVLTGGAGTGAAAWIKAVTGQTLDAGIDFTLTGGAAGAYADIVTTTGAQNIGNQNSSGYYDQTNSIKLTGGSAGNSYARIATLGGAQNVQASTGIQLIGGIGDNSGALLLSATGQTVATAASLSITGGIAATTGGNESGLRNTTSGTQSVQAGSNMDLIGGGASSDVWIKQTGNGAQTIGSGAALTLKALTAGADVVSIEAGAGGQALSVADAVSVNNASANVMQIASGADQTISADALSLVLSSTTGTAPKVAITATGNQVLTLNGGIPPTAPVTTPGPATLTVSNLSATAGSQALLQAGGNQTIAMNYLSAGMMQVGDIASQGVSKVYATGNQTIVAGELLVQGGSTATATATLSDGTSTSGTMLISTLGGPMRVLGGAAGAAAIDPLNLSAVANGSILLTSGAASTAGASVTAGVINMTATNGNMAVIGGGAAATVLASSTSTAAGVNSFNLNNSGGLTISGGSVSATAGGVVLLGGPCIGCANGLVGPFTVTAPPATVNYSANLLVTNVVALLDQTLLDLVAAGYDLVVAEDGTVTSYRRGVSQCF